MISLIILIFIFGLFVGILSMDGGDQDFGQNLAFSLMAVSTGFVVTIFISVTLTFMVIDAFDHNKAMQFIELLRIYQ